MTTTFKQLITDKTFIGTSDPVNLHNSLSYFGPNGPDAEKTTLELTHKLLDHYFDTHTGQSFSVQLSADITAGIALPSWTANITVENGEITSDTMKLTIMNNTIMGGMFAGAELTFNFIMESRTWQSGSAYWRGWRHGWGWHPGHWNEWNSFNKSIRFDLIPMGVNLIVTLVGMIPKLDALLTVIPKGLLNHTQDFEQNGIVDKDGVFINASMPMKWALVTFSRTLAESGLEVASLAATPATTTVVTLLIEIGNFFIKLINKLKILSIEFGPQLDLVFPLRITITELIASSSDAPEKVYQYDSLTFSGDTIVGTNNSTDKISDGTVNMDRIGMHFKQSIELPTVNLGVWCHIAIFVVFSGSPSKDFRMMELLEKELGFDLDLANFHSSMSNTIGGSGEGGIMGDVPSSVEVKFI